MSEKPELKLRHRRALAKHARTCSVCFYALFVFEGTVGFECAVCFECAVAGVLTGLRPTWSTHPRRPRQTGGCAQRGFRALLTRIRGPRQTGFSIISAKLY